MAFNFYDTHTLLASVQQLPPLHSFLLDRYFPTNAASDVFATDDVLVEYRKGSKKAAPFVAPRKGGITILREGYTMKRFTPAHIAPKRPLSIDDLKKRGFGEALYTNLTPAQRQGVIMLGDLDELRDMNTRRKEAMAAEVIFTNGCIMHEYTDDLGTYEEKEVRYYDGTSNPAKYTPSADWADTEAGGKQMIDDVAAPIPSVCVQLMEGSDELIQKKRQLQIRLCLACWNPGQHGGEIFNPRENAKATGGYSYYVNTGEAAKTYSRNMDGWRDCYNLADLVLREIETAEYIAGHRLVKEQGIKFGPFTEDGNVWDYYPYWHSWISFALEIGTTPAIPKEYEEFL